MSTLERTTTAPAAGRGRDRTLSGAPPAAAVSVENLTKVYGDFRAVDDLDLVVHRGEVLGLLGPNGAGKTSTIDLLVGLRRPTRGSVRVLGLDPAVDRAALTARVAVQPQEASLYDSLTVAETLRLFASLHQAPLAVADVARRVGLEDQAGVRAKKLSGGQRRRLLLGVALVGDPELVVLDEPSAGLDPAARQGLWELVTSLREHGTTVVLTTHHMDEAAALCDRVAIVVDGRLVALGSPDELVRRRSAQRRVSCTVAPGADLAALRTRGDVVDVVASDGPEGRVTVTTTDSDALVAHLAGSGYAPRDLIVGAQTLEDVFLDLAATSGTSPRRHDGAPQGGRDR